jgi:hypothetical protein
MNPDQSEPVPEVDEDPKNLYLTRPVAADEAKNQCEPVLDQWVATIPFSPIKSFKTETEFRSAVEHAAYEVKVDTQIELRWFDEHEVPYIGQALPASPVSASTINDADIPFEIFADFAEHKESIDLVETRRKYSCNRCAASGRIQCTSCAGRGEVACGSCSGSGQRRCSTCYGAGQIKGERQASRLVTCGGCQGRGRIGNPSSTCERCNGSGTTLSSTGRISTVRAPPARRPERKPVQAAAVVGG